MMDITEGRGAFICWYAPVLCRAFDQHLTSCCTGDAHSELAGETNGRTAPGGLQIANLRNFHRAGFNQWHQK